MTYVRAWSGWAYVAFVPDVYSRMIVGWQVANHMRTELPLDALEMAATEPLLDRLHRPDCCVDCTHSGARYGNCAESSHQ
ncbi:DDE-type integrase/transposase/recombinase [Streptomyces sp. NPDC091376]|uniref:DDE-type integrase/transposase/recombinase n=1 Tax=Streptomyces sp. NPDC091376 TaxID=3365994 RepID=UPI003814C02F